MKLLFCVQNCIMIYISHLMYTYTCTEQKNTTTKKQNKKHKKMFRRRDSNPTLRTIMLLIRYSQIRRFSTKIWVSKATSLYLAQDLFINLSVCLYLCVCPCCYLLFWFSDFYWYDRRKERTDGQLFLILYTHRFVRG